MLNIKTMMIIIIFFVVVFIKNIESINNLKSKEYNQTEEYQGEDESTTIFPKSIPIFKVRKDIDTKKPVSRGKIVDIINILDLKNDKNTPIKKRPIKELRKELQCSPVEPDLDILGVMSLLKEAQPTKSGLLSVCASVSVIIIPMFYYYYYYYYFIQLIVN